MRLLLDLLFPPRCVGCHARGGWLCAFCRAGLPCLPPERCRRCAVPLTGVAVCPSCWRDPPPFGCVTTAFRFEGTVRTAIHQLKYRGARHLARPLSDALLDAIQPIETPEILVPVPLHPARLAERGYNQSTLLAQAMGRRLGVPVLETGLVRLRDTPAQVKVPAGQRWTNVRDAFAVPTRELVGRYVVLVDDVATTSSTLRAASRAVVLGGAARVDAIVVARTMPTAQGGNGTIVA